MTRKKITPRWLSITRKLYTYIGGTSIFSLVFNRYGLDQATRDLIIQLYLLGLAAIQGWCDLSYKKELPQDFKPEPKNIKS